MFAGVLNLPFPDKTQKHDPGNDVLSWVIIRAEPPLSLLTGSPLHVFRNGLAVMGMITAEKCEGDNGEKRNPLAHREVTPRGVGAGVYP